MKNIKTPPSLLYVGLRLLQSYLIRFTVLSACAFSSLLVVHDDSRRSPSIRFQDHDDENKVAKENNQHQRLY
jgi:hypothetical protein